MKVYLDNAATTPMASEVIAEMTEDGKVSMRTKKICKKQRNYLLHSLYWRDWECKQLQHFELKHWFEQTSREFNEFCSNALPDII